MKHSRLAVVLLCMTGVSACTDQPPGAPDTTPSNLTISMAVYDEVALDAVFSEFTKATSIPVTVRVEKSAASLTGIAGDSSEPPADLLIFDSIADGWRASDDGALRRLGEDSVGAELPGSFVDPDRHWIALGISSLQIVTSAPAADRSMVGFADLAGEHFRGRLCLTVSARPENRALIALLIRDHGQRPAEVLVRGWLSNLARPPLRSPQEVFDEVTAGVCDYAILPARSLPVLTAASGISAYAPARGAVVAHVAGIARHARQPEAAARFIGWLAGPDGQASFAQATGSVSAFEYPAGEMPDNLAGRALLDGDAALLAERAGWQ